MKNKIHDYGDLQESVSFFQGVCMGLLFSIGMLALIWLMLSY